MPEIPKLEHRPVPGMVGGRARPSPSVPVMITLGTGDDRSKVRSVTVVTIWVETIRKLQGVGAARRAWAPTMLRGSVGRVNAQRGGDEQRQGDSRADPRKLDGAFHHGLKIRGHSRQKSQAARPPAATPRIPLPIASRSLHIPVCCVSASAAVQGRPWSNTWDT